MAALTLGWLGYRFFSPKKRKKAKRDASIYPMF